MLICLCATVICPEIFNLTLENISLVLRANGGFDKSVFVIGDVGKRVKGIEVAEIFFNNISGLCVLLNLLFVGLVGKV